MDFGTIRERMVDYLQGQGIGAQCAYPEISRVRRDGAVAAVSLRACQGGPGGFRDYLGGHYEEERGQGEELLQSVHDSLVDLDGAGELGCGAAGIQETFDRMAEALQREGPPGLTLQELSCGETEFDQGAGLYHRAVEAVCRGYLYAVAQEGGTFLDFIVRGESRI